MILLIQTRRESTAETLLAQDDGMSFSSVSIADKR